MRRLCSSGSFCPVPGGPEIPCPNGTLCDEGSFAPSACQVGKFCTNGEVRDCPSGHYCSYACDCPTKCHWLAWCPGGSGSEGWIFTAIAFVILAALATSAGMKHYDIMVEKGWPVCLVCFLLTALMFVVDWAVGGFLFLQFAVVAVNWKLLKLGVCPRAVARTLMVFTLGGALVLLWLVHPPWAVLVANLLLVGSLGWLMSRQKFAVVLLGRLLLLVALLVLICFYWLVDRTFAIIYISVLVVAIIVLFCSWALEKRRQHSQHIPLPFGSQWVLAGGELRHFGAGGQQSHVAGRPEALLPRDPLVTASAGFPVAAEARVPPVGDLGGSPVATSSHLGPAEAGVSFRLNKVSYFTPDGKRLLDDISLVIEAGLKVAVMGPSGCGKSTLLSVLSGRASSGSMQGQLLVSGQETDDLRFLKDVTGFVPQDDCLHTELTVEENIRFQAMLRLPANSTPQLVAERIRHVAQNLKLDEQIMQKVVGVPGNGVSGGQRKRVSIAMEVVADPWLLFADEPTSGLDSTTSHEVVDCLCRAADAPPRTTTITVIHQPRYDTLLLFDTLVLLAAGTASHPGGRLVYAGPTGDVKQYFKGRLQVDFRPEDNPADRMLDAIQTDPSGAGASAKDLAELWEKDERNNCAHERREERVVHRTHFFRMRKAFFQGVLIFADRSMLQTMRALWAFLMNQILCVFATVVLCNVLVYERLDQFMMQSAFAALFLMLLQGVAAQRIFGADLQMTWREARVGAPMMAYFCAKDIVALFEVTASAAIFTATYGSLSGAHMAPYELFAGSWAFVYCVFGMSYMYSIILPPGSAQMSMVASAFVSFCVAGVYQPQLPEIAAMFGGRGWMIPMLSPVRWLYGYLLTVEVPRLTQVSQTYGAGSLASRGYDLQNLNCSSSLAGTKDPHHAITTKEAWKDNCSWVCSTAPMILLGLIFRFLAGCCLLLFVYGQTSGWSKFLGQSKVGVWKLAGNMLAMLVVSFFGLFFFAEIWVFGVLDLFKEVERVFDL